MINSSGIGTYIKNIIPSLSNEYDLILIGNSNEIKNVFQKSLIDNIQIINCTAPIYSITEQIQLPKLIPSCDIFWTPHINIPLFPIKAKKRIVTIMDMFHYAHLKELSIAKRIYTKVILNRAVTKSSLIFTISEYSKKEIVKYTRVDEKKVHTIKLGIDLNYFRRNDDLKKNDTVRKRYRLPQNYILFVGNVKPHKNLKNLLIALSIMKENKSNHKLVIVGKKDGFITGDSGLEEVIKAYNLAEDVIFTGFADKEDLPIIYSAASIFCFPSLYEGFGFPPLEAMACGVPTAVSNSTSIPEVCGEASVYFDPTEPEDIARRLLNTLTDVSLKNQLILKGYKKVLEYTWLNCINSHLEKIHALLGFGMRV
jgi:glycosyltransferase involved in cell wall biosynthesis